MERWKLIADAGGTNVRFARSPGAGIVRDIKRLNVADFPTFLDALNAYLAGFDLSSCEGAGIAAAGPVRSGEILLTNGTWRICADEVSSVLGGVGVTLYNDLEAVALALPYLEARNVRPIGEISSDLSAQATRIAINIGTGFGAAAAIPVAVGWVSVASEAGHISFSAANEREAEMLSSYESIEDLLSGRGVRRLYQDVCQRQGRTAEIESTDLPVFAQPAGDLAAAEALEIFSRLLARISGDLVLATAAWGGVFFCGSVARAWSEKADSTAFRATFEKKGSMSARMQSVGASLILLDEPALHGLTYAATRR